MNLIGNYWHSIENKFPGYHLLKTELCEAQDHRLIHIWEDEWNNKTKEKLKLIFENKEIIPNENILDRSWFSTNQFKDRKIEMLLPEIIERNDYKVENCGYLKILSLN